MSEHKPDLTVTELSELSGLEVSWIRRLLIDGKIKGYKRAGAWFVPDAEARQWLAARRDDKPPDKKG